MVAVDHSGRIFVGEHRDSRIYVFAADGSLVEAIGRRGSGPGEFASLESIYAGAGDTLYVFDSGLERMSAYKPDDLELAYDFPASEDSLGWPYWLVGVLDTGFLVTYGWPATPDDAVEDRRMHVMRVDWTGQVRPPPVYDLPGSEWLFSGEGADRIAMGKPFGRAPVFRLGPGGKLYAGWTESVDITVIAPDGTYGHTITHALAPIPLTRDEIERSVEGISEDRFREFILEASLSATKPAYETFVVSDHGRIWLKVTTPSIADTTAQWLILNAESQLRGKVELPVTSNLHVVRGDRAYAVTHSEEISLVVYQVRE